MLLSNKDYGGDLSCFAKQVFDILIFFSELANHIMSLYYHYQTFIICLNQIDTPPTAFWAERLCYSSLFKWWHHLIYWRINSQKQFEHRKFNANL